MENESEQGDDDDIAETNSRVSTSAIEPPQPPSLPFLFINNVPIYFSEDWDTGIGGGLWSTGMAMAKYFERYPAELISNLNNLSGTRNIYQHREPGSCVGNHRRSGEQFKYITNHKSHGSFSTLELGSGNGFLSVCFLAACLHCGGPKHLNELVVTDTADHLSLIAKTLKANSHVWGDESLEPSMVENGKVIANRDFQTLGHTYVSKRHSNSLSIAVAEHRWGEFSSKDSVKSNQQHHRTNFRPDTENKFDFIFGTDLAYRDSLHEPLISSLLHFSHDETICMIGVTMNDTKPCFFDLLTKSGFRYERLADHWLEGEFQGGNFGIFIIQRRDNHM